MTLSSHTCQAIVASIAFVSPAVAADPVPVELKLSVFDETKPVAADLKKLGEPYQTALKNAEAPMQRLLTSYASSLQRGLDKAKAGGDLRNLEYFEGALASWKLGNLPTGAEGPAWEMDFVMKSPEAYGQSRKLFAAVIKRLTQEDKVDVAKALEARLEEIGNDFGTRYGSPLQNGVLLQYTFSVDGDFLHRLGAAQQGPGPRKGIKEILEQRGVNFPKEAAATLVGGKLIVRNTRVNLYMIQALIKSL